MPRRMIRSCLLALLSMVASDAALAQGTRPSSATGSSAAERREMVRTLAEREEELDRLGERLGLTRRLMRVLAAQVGLGNPNFTEREFFAAVGSTAERARALLNENTTMRGELETLRDPAVRDPALALLAQARTALDEGRLADAEALYGQLGAVRWGESDEALAASLSAVQSQTIAAELQGGEADYDRADQLRREASRRFRELEQRTAIQRITVDVQRVRSALQEGELFGRRRGLLRAISIFKDEMLEEAANEEFSVYWMPAHQAYARALFLLGQSNGGETGATYLSEGLSHLIDVSRRNEVVDLAVLPIDLRLTFMDLVFARLSLMDGRQINEEMTSGPFASAAQSAMNSLSMGALSTPENITREQVNLMFFMGRHAIPLIQRSDIADQLPGVDDSEWAIMQRQVHFAGFGIAFLLVAVANGIPPFPILIDVQSEPNIWMDSMMLSADLFISASDNQMVLRQFNITNPELVLVRSIEVLRQVEQKAIETNNYVILSEAKHLRATALLKLSKQESASQIVGRIREAIQLFHEALELRPRNEMPLAWSRSSLALAEAELAMAAASAAESCDFLQLARARFSEALPIFAERQPPYAIEQLRLQQSLTDRRVESECS